MSHWEAGTLSLSNGLKLLFLVSLDLRTLGLKSVPGAALISPCSAPLDGEVLREGRCNSTSGGKKKSFLCQADFFVFEMASIRSR